MNKNKQHPIETEDFPDIQAKMFRLFNRDGTGACKRDLHVRFDWTEDGWVATFYRWETDCISRSKKISDFTAKDADLVAEAMQRLAQLSKTGKTGSTALEFEA